jgi:hypothetical protein
MLRSRPKLVYKKYLLVQNTPRSQDSPVINTLGSLYSLVDLSPESFFGKSVLNLVQNIHYDPTTRCVHHRGVKTPGVL